MTLFVLTELVGIAAFAVSGAQVAIACGLDLFGIVVLGCTTAVGGGVIRDLLLGIAPPAMFQNPSYVALAAAVSVATFLLVRYTRKGWLHLSEHRMASKAVDALGLGVFAVSGVNTAIATGFNSNRFLTVFVGVLTAVGGGILRDVLVHRTPVILERRIYALAALAGALCHSYLTELLPPGPAIWLSVALVVVLRVLAAHYRWQLPR